MNSDRFGELDQAFLPFSTSRDLKMGRNGSMDCWRDSGSDPDGDAGVNAPCVCIPSSVQLATPAKEADSRRSLPNSSAQQRRSGPYERPTNGHLPRAQGWRDDTT